MPISHDHPQPHGLPWVIVGYGRVGQSLALLAEQLGQTVSATWNRSQQALQNAAIPSPNPCLGPPHQALAPLLNTPSLVWITVVDDAIKTIFDEIAPSLVADSIVVHTSGSQASTLLGGHPQLAVASLHPLQAISDPQAAVARFPRSFWSIEGDDRAVEYLCQLLRPAQIDPIRLKAQHKTLYHAAAVTAANLLVSLLDSAIAIADAAAIDPLEARQMLIELAQSSLDNLRDHSPAQALTGPASRGDLKVIDDHRHALAQLDDPSLLQIYDLLTARALDGLSD